MFTNIVPDHPDGLSFAFEYLSVCKFSAMILKRTLSHCYQYLIQCIEIFGKLRKQVVLGCLDFLIVLKFILHELFADKPKPKQNMKILFKVYIGKIHMVPFGKKNRSSKMRILLARFSNDTIYVNLTKLLFQVKFENILKIIIYPF